MEAISLPLASIIIQILGLPGLIFIIWHFDNKKLEKQRQTYEAVQQEQREMYEAQAAKQREMYEREASRQREEHTRELTKILGQYRQDVAEIRKLYENNAGLVRDYQSLAQALMDTVRLSTQASTELITHLRTRKTCHELLGLGEAKP